MKNIISYFAGANTKYGFLNKFDEMASKQKPSFRYVIKGGAGTGKSTLMKKVGEHFALKGEQIEYFYCSSDSNSLDGIRIVDKNICIVDGTAPHIIEASLPMINDKIINVGEYISEDVKLHRKSIFKALEKKQKFFSLCYDYIKCASNVYENNYKIYQKYYDKKIVEQTVKNIIKQIEPKLKSATLPRQLFFDNIEKHGLNDISVLNNSKKIVFTTSPYSANKIFSELSHCLCLDGYEVVEIINLLLPNTIKAIFLPETNLLIESVFEIDKTKDKKILEFNNSIVLKLLAKAGNYLFMAKQEHKKIEKHYIPNMNFEELNKLTNKIIYEIEKNK